MWIISVGYRGYVREVLTGWEAIMWRDDATKFETRQEAKDFISKYGIQGHVIPY